MHQRKVSSLGQQRSGGAQLSWNDGIYQRMHSTSETTGEHTENVLSDSQFVRNGFVIECTEHVEDIVVRLQLHFGSLETYALGKQKY